jgi:uncharacterized protein
MAAVEDGDAVDFVSAAADAAFAATHMATGPPAPAPPGSLEHFLVERYRLFAERRGRLVTAEVAHEPWELQPADAEIRLNRMAPPGVEFAGEPLVHVCRGVDALISTPAPVRSARAARTNALVAG